MIKNTVETLRSLNKDTMFLRAPSMNLDVETSKSNDGMNPSFQRQLRYEDHDKRIGRNKWYAKKYYLDSTDLGGTLESDPTTM